MLAEKTPIGPDVEPYVDAVRELVDAGVQSVYIHQVGPDQEGFFRFFREELQPELAKLVGAGGKRGTRKGTKQPGKSAMSKKNK